MSATLTEDPQRTERVGQCRGGAEVGAHSFDSFLSVDKGIDHGSHVRI